MNLNDAIERLKNENEQCFDECEGCCSEVENEICTCRDSIILSALQQYRAIGTVKECREARERQRAKRVYSKDGKLNHCEADRALSCPVCKAQLNYCEYQDIPFCYNCGQKLDWSDTP